MKLQRRATRWTTTVGWPASTIIEWSPYPEADTRVNIAVVEATEAEARDASGPIEFTPSKTAPERRMWFFQVTTTDRTERTCSMTDTPEMPDEPEVPKQLRDTIRDFVDEANYAFEILLEHVQKQAAAEPTYNTALIVKVVFEMTADYMVREHGWSMQELCDELLKR